MTWREARRGAVERQPRMGDRMRLDRDHLAARADMTRQHHGVGADIGADIDEHAAGGRMRAQEIQFLEIVVGIEQGAALGGAGLMIEPKRRALIVDIDRPRAQQVDQPRQHRAERAALQPRAMRERDDRMLRAVGANAPNGGDAGSLAAAMSVGSVDVKRSSRKACGSGGMHSRSLRTTPTRRRASYPYPWKNAHAAFDDAALRRRRKASALDTGIAGR